MKQLQCKILQALANKLGMESENYGYTKFRLTLANFARV